jgi:putative flippase GtrA
LALTVIETSTWSAARRSPIAAGVSAASSKAIASLAALIVNFVGRRYIVFRQRARGDWKPSV